MSEARDTHARIQAILSELRSLAHMPRWEREERETLWLLLCESFDLDVTQHETIITSYLSELTGHLTEPLRDAHDAQTMRQMIAIAPCATFRLMTAKPQQLASLRSPELARHLGAIRFEPYGQHLSSLDLLIEQADALDHLTELDLSHNTLSTTHIKQLTGSSLFARLTTLSLHHCKLGLEEIKTLCEHGAPNRLVELRISENQPGLEGFTAIFEQLCTPGMERLDLHASAFSSMGNKGRDTFLQDEGLEALATSANLQNLRALRANFSRLSAHGLAHLATSRHVTALKELVLDTNPEVGPGGAHLIATSENFRHLKHLSLASCQLGLEGAAHLANSSTLGSLRVLDLHSDKLEDEGVIALVKSPLLQGIEVLHLGVNRLEDEGVATLLSSRKIAALRTLSLYGNHLGERACRALTENGEVELESLNVSRCKLGDADGALLLGSPRLSKLSELIIKSNALGTLSARAIAQSTCLGALETLDLSENDFDEQMCAMIFSSPSLRRLRHLFFGGNTPGMRGLLALTRADFFEQLETLTLRKSSLDSEQLRLLARGGKLPKLRKLDLGYNHTLKDIEGLFGAPFLPQLRSLNISQCSVDEDQVERLIALPGLNQELREDLHQQRRRMFEYY